MTPQEQIKEWLAERLYWKDIWNNDWENEKPHVKKTYYDGATYLMRNLQDMGAVVKVDGVIEPLIKEE